MSGGIERERPHVERTPQQPSQPEQTQPLQGSAEGRKSLQGPTTVGGSEQLQSQQESSAKGALSRMWGKIGDRQATFRCILPEITIPPVHLRPMLRKGSVTEEQAQEFEQEWREELKNWDRQSLEEAVRDLEKELDSASHSKRQEQVHDIKYQLEIMRDQLRRRES